MALTARNAAQHELIGLEAEVVAAKNKTQEGLKGRVIDETRDTIVIEKEGKPKRLIKSQITLKAKVNDEYVMINGKILVGRPEERIKKLKRLK